MQTSYDIIHTLIRTEKGTRLEPAGQYLFEVAKVANKLQIRKAVEEIYNVKVAAVNTQVIPGKRKRVRKEFGYAPDWKKAIVTLRSGSKIDVT
ncbi:MAG: 50S ribosomal protein L23 [Candidatus Omnitrophica bacterium]|nr:50S ribosomal protein L23 [Candidatus Omnitrophota bacterium]